MSRPEEPRLRGVHRAALTGSEHRSVSHAQAPCGVEDGPESADQDQVTR